MEEDFPGGPMVKTPCFHCRWHKFYPWSGSKIPLEAWHGGKKKKKSVWMQMGRRERRGEKKGAVTPTSNQELLVAATGSS